MIEAPLGARLVHALHQALPARRVLGAVGQEEPHRSAGLLRQPGHPGEFGRLVDKIAVHAEGAAADRGHRLADAVKLRLLGEMAGDEVAVIGLVRIGARGGEAERAGAQRFLGQPPHLGDVFGGGGFAVDAALAHHEDAQRVVRDLRADIDGARHAVERVEIFGEALPIPFEALGERAAGDVLDRLHEVDEAGAVLAPDRREADPAIAEEDRRHAVPRRRRKHRVPGCLAVVMRVDIDPAGGDEEAVGVDLAPARPGLAADLRQAVAIDRHIAGDRVGASAVEDGAAANDDIVHLVSPAIPLQSMSLGEVRRNRLPCMGLCRNV